MTQKAFAFLKRFIKGFVGGGVSSLLVSLHSGIAFSSWSDFVHVLLSAFLTGALLATEKMMNWDDTQTTVPDYIE